MKAHLLYPALLIILGFRPLRDGLRTQVGLLNDSNAWLICAGLILIATIGNLVAP